MLRVTFYGVRGGYAASGEGFTAVGSHTTCFRIDAGGHVIVIDGGTGFAPLGRDLINKLPAKSSLQINLFLTHGHHDHLSGLPHCPAVFSQRVTFHVFGPPAMGVEKALLHMFSPPWFPVRFDELLSQWHLHDLAESEEVVFVPAEKDSSPVVRRHMPRQKKPGPDSVLVEVMRSYAHPRAGVYLYRISHGGRSIVVATDVEAFVGNDRRLAKFAQGADLLIHDAQYSEEQYLGQPTQGFGHSTPQMAAELASVSGVKRLLLTHHSPGYEDEKIIRLVEEARRIFPKTDAAMEGLVVDLRTRTSAAKR